MYKFYIKTEIKRLFIFRFCANIRSIAQNEKNPAYPNPTQDLCNASISNVILAVNNLTEMASKIMPKNLRMI